MSTAKPWASPMPDDQFSVMRDIIPAPKETIPAMDNEVDLKTVFKQSHPRLDDTVAIAHWGFDRSEKGTVRT